MFADFERMKCAQFAACLGQDFTLTTAHGSAILQLAEARPLAVQTSAAREAFSLVFRGLAPLRLPQGIYRLSHPRLGDMELFLVQITADQSASTFEAVFN